MENCASWAAYSEESIGSKGSWYFACAVSICKNVSKSEDSTELDSAGGVVGEEPAPEDERQAQRLAQRLRLRLHAAQPPQLLLLQYGRQQREAPAQRRSCSYIVLYYYDLGEN